MSWTGFSTTPGRGGRGTGNSPPSGEGPPSGSRGRGQGPPSGGRGRGQGSPPGGAGTSSSPVPRARRQMVRDGRSFQTPILSLGLERNRDERFTYIVNHLGQWIEANFVEARHYTQVGFTVLNVATQNPVDWNDPLQVPETGDAFRRQFEEIDRLSDEDYNERNKRFETPPKAGSKASTPSKSGSQPGSKSGKRQPPGSDGKEPPKWQGPRRDGSGGAGSAAAAGSVF